MNNMNYTAASTANTYANTPAFGMKWHKFLVNFSLWLSAIANIIIGAMSIAIALIPDIIGGNTALMLASASIGLLTIASAVYLIKVRFNLAKFKAGAPKQLLIAQLISLAASMLFMIVSCESFDLSSLVSGLASILVTKHYYDKRSSLFVN